MVLAVLSENNGRLQWLLERSRSASDTVVVFMDGEKKLATSLVSAAVNRDIEAASALLDAGTNPHFRCVGGGLDGMSGAGCGSGNGR